MSLFSKRIIPVLFIKNGLIVRSQNFNHTGDWQRFGSGTKIE